MKTIRISAFAHGLVRDAAASWGSRLTDPTSRELADGSVEVVFEDETFEALARVDPDPEVAIRRALGVPGYPIGRA